MKKWMKVIMIIAGCLAAAGIVLDLVVLAFHGFDWTRLAKGPDSESLGIVEHEFQSSSGDYQRIECTTGAMDVVVETGDVDKVQITVNELQDWLEEGEETLFTLTDEGNGVLSLSYVPDRNLDYGSTLTFGTSLSPESQWIGIKVVLPRGFSGSLDFQAGSGDLNFTDLNGMDLSIGAGSGCISLVTCRFKTIDLQTGSGDIYLHDADSQGTIKAHSDSGDIDTEQSDAAGIEFTTGSGCIYLTGNEAQAVTLQTSSGDVNLYGLGCDSLSIITGSGEQSLDEVDASHIQLRSGSGYIAAYLYGAYGDYRMALEPQSGDLTVIDENEEEIMRTHTDAGDRTLAVSSDSGDIEVRFYGMGGYSGKVGNPE